MRDNLKKKVADSEVVVDMLGVDGRLWTTLLLGGAIFAPTAVMEQFAAVAAQYDHLVFWLVIAAFIIVSVIGTKVVLRSGELPANDELFNLRELTPVQRAALRGDHVVGEAASAAAAG